MRSLHNKVYVKPNFNHVNLLRKTREAHLLTRVHTTRIVFRDNFAC